MEKIIKQLLKRGDFVQAVAEEMGKELAERQIADSWFTNDWSCQFYSALTDTVNKSIQNEVEIYIQRNGIDKLIEHTFRAYIVKNLSELLEKKYE